MHIEVERYAERYAEHAKRGVTYRKELGKAEKLFLEHVWGPVFDYRFDGLQAEYPFKDFKGQETSRLKAGPSSGRGCEFRRCGKSVRRKPPYRIEMVAAHGESRRFGSDSPQY